MLDSQFVHVTVESVFRFMGIGKINEVSKNLEFHTRAKNSIIGLEIEMSLLAFFFFFNPFICLLVYVTLDSLIGLAEIF